MPVIEAVSLAIGVLPIFIEIIKSYGEAKARLNTFRRYHEAVKEIRLDFSLEEKTFRTECYHLLLVIIEDGHDLQHMLQKPEDSRWHDRELNNRLQAFLGSDYDVCEEVVIKIRSILRQTAADLDQLIHLDQISNTTGFKEAAADAFRQLGQAFNVAAKENKYKKRLRDLHSWNARFRRLRKQNCSVKKPLGYHSASVITRSLPSSFSKIREASQTLHASLEDAWSCSKISHEAHQARLWLNAEADYDSVRLDIAISCRQTGAQAHKRPLTSPIWLHVQSLTTKSEPSLPTAKVALPLFQPVDAGSTPLQDEKSKCIKQSKTAAVVAKIKRVKKRVRFDTDTAAGDDSKPPAPKEAKKDTPLVPVNAQCFSMLNLRDTDSFCCHLSNICTSQGECNASCLGFLESQNAFKFIFYDAGIKASGGAKLQSDLTETIPLNATLGNLQPLQRLELAHKLATAVLHYHQTPWLPEDWQLRDLSFFSSNADITEDDSAEKLETLHLSTQFPKPHQPIGAVTALQSTSKLPTSCATPNTLSTTCRYTYGIRNMTLSKLGVALLEIGHDQDISSFNLGQPHDVQNARILLDMERPTFGKRYQDLARKCVECTFLSNDLNDKELQVAVYSQVVCELEDLMDLQKRLTG